MKKKETRFKLKTKPESENNPLGLNELDKHRFEDYLNSLIDAKILEGYEKELLKRIDKEFHKVIKEITKVIEDDGEIKINISKKNKMAQEIKPTASKKEIVAEKLTIDNYKQLQRFGYEGAKFERNGGYTHFIAFKSKTEDAIIYEEEGKIKGKIWLKDADTKDFDYISIEDLVELEFKRD
jgi:hypothetical protein